MKAHYFEGHEKHQPVQVTADLDISKLDLESIDWETELSPQLKKLIDSDE